MTSRARATELGSACLMGMISTARCESPSESSCSISDATFSIFSSDAETMTELEPHSGTATTRSLGLRENERNIMLIAFVVPHVSE